jgi:CheY-like chemotaxis protein/AraC-like DNA-binding protein
MDRFKSRFYTNITHEFRTPLTLILGQAEEVKARVDRDLRIRLHSIERQGRHLLRLVNQLLDLARLEGGRLQLQPVQADLIAFLSYLADSFHSVAEAKDIDLRFEPGESEMILDYDPERLQQVVGNLLSNALKFTPGQGEVVLGCRSLSAGQVPEAAPAQPASHWLEVWVADTGPKIPPEDLDRIFDRFFQAESPDTQQGAGSGIGLALARELTHLMGGTLQVDSTLGQGSTFRVYLPVRQEAPPATPKPMAESGSSSPVPAERPTPLTESADGERPLLLLVEDHPELRSYLHKLLEADYRLLEAENGEAGLKQARAEVPDLIISDVMMPEMDGYALCQRLKEDLPTSHIPIILLTARADTQSRLQGLEGGADAYLAKPFERDELLLRVRKLIEGRRKLQAYYRSLLGGSASAEPPSSLEAPAEAAFVSQARQTVEDHLDEPDFGPEQLQEALAVSRTQLYRKLKSLTGYSASRFIRHIRLQHARNKLLTSRANITEIAFDCGFSDPGYFGRVFTEEFGLPPSKYRARHHPNRDLEQ